MIALSVLTACSEQQSDMTLSDLRVNYMADPVGLDEEPSFSWKLEAPGRQRKQSAYRILVGTSPEELQHDRADVWDSGKRDSDAQLHIPFEGDTLMADQRYYWKVQVWDETGAPSPWSEMATWSSGLMVSSNWEAEWIGPSLELQREGMQPKPWGNGIKKNNTYVATPAQNYRKTFSLEEQPVRAPLHVSAHGVYTVFINGKRVGKDEFTPGWTEYRKRLYYNSYDVADLLQQGENTIAVIVADGWYRGMIANRRQSYYGKYLALLAQMEVELPDGKREKVLTDESWKFSFGPIVESDMQGGETYDGRKEMSGWDRSGFEDASWLSVESTDTINYPDAGYPGIPVRKVGEVEPVRLTQRAPRQWVVDMGQNYAGWVRLKVSGNVGDSITLRFAEHLNEDGSLHTRNLRTVRANDTYVVGKEGEQKWEPMFTYHGFRYVEVSGPNDLKKEDIIGVVLGSDLEHTGSFSCSDPLIEQIDQNIGWSLRSNYFDVPTDCPQRDERMGWTGDAQLFFGTAAYHMNVAPFFRKWLFDIEDGQFREGSFPSTAPRVYYRVASGWGDAGVIIPWELYEMYDDVSFLRRHVPSMERWMAYLDSISPDGISRMGSYGDWQNLDDEVPIRVFSTAYWKQSAELMSKIHTVLGNAEKAADYKNLTAEIARAFNDSLIALGGLVEGETQSGQIMALYFEMVPEERKPVVFGHLVKMIEENDTALSTGIHGTRMALEVLSQHGRSDLAYALLQRAEYPSWGYQVEQGATTIWERWDSQKREVGMHEDSTNSLNHYAFGSMGEWFYSHIGGIRNGGEGYKHTLIAPEWGGRLTHADVSYTSLRGTIRSNWTVTDQETTLDVTVPVNTTAEIILPIKESVYESGKPITECEDLRVLEGNGTCKVLVGSGSYSFRWNGGM